MADDGRSELDDLMRLLALPDEGERRRALERVAGEHPSEELRHRARKLLGELRRGEAGLQEQGTSPPLDEAALRATMASGDRQAKLAAVNAVMARGDPATADLMVELLKTELDPWVVARLVKAAAHPGVTRHIPALQDYLRHQDLRVQANTIEALETIGDDVMVTLLVPMLASRDNRVRANAVKALARRDRDQALQALGLMARSDKAWMRDSAVYCLAMIDDPRVEPILIEMLEAEPTSELAKRQLELLADRGTVAAAGLLGWLRRSGRAPLAGLAEAALGRLATRLGLDEARLGEAAETYAGARAAREVEGLPPLDGELDVGRAAGEGTPFGALRHLAAQFPLPAGLAALMVLAAAVTLLTESPEPFTEAPTPVSVAAVHDPPEALGAVLRENQAGQRIRLLVRVRLVDERLGVVLARYEDKLLAVRPSNEPWPWLRQGRWVTVDGRLAGEDNHGVLQVDYATVAPPGAE